MISGKNLIIRILWIVCRWLHSYHGDWNPHFLWFVPFNSTFHKAFDMHEQFFFIFKTFLNLGEVHFKKKRLIFGVFFFFGRLSRCHFQWSFKKRKEVLQGFRESSPWWSWWAVHDLRLQFFTFSSFSFVLMCYK